MQFGGFCELYSVDVSRPNNKANTDRGKQRGLRSPHGRRGAICAHFGWTLDYLTNGIAWSTVQKMMIDAPSYDTEEEEGEVEDMILTDSNSESIMEYVNSMM